ncbi:hypothetical protein LXT12_00195 [Pelomonas sp. P7]|uniref:Autotransporter-associated beta strand repeat-containing protein n=1 Tax=Pelomonas caseinilytica TaxID=2906763 RepID=A0ABS8X5S8_9BURK|nr:hypothetical protein [Pelomonas sp. P7]MCE4535682.1 hypothetical protein [Pelomonas sp. P7]
MRQARPVPSPFCAPKARRLLAGSLCLATLAAPLPASADRYWSSMLCHTASWWNTCWTSQPNSVALVGAPGPAESAFITGNAAFSTTVTFAGPDATVAALQLAGTSRMLTFEQLSGRLLADAAIIASAGNATWSGRGGELAVKGSLTLAESAGSSATAVWGAGYSVTASTLVAGVRGEANVRQQGAAVRTDTLVLGLTDAAISRYQLQSGSLTVTGSTSARGNSLLEWDGGSLALGAQSYLHSASFGANGGAAVSFAQSAGQQVGFDGTLTLGVLGRASYTQQGGTLTTGQGLTLAEVTGSHGELTTAGGQANLTGVVVGMGGTGRWTMTGGKATVNQPLMLGQLGGGSGTLDLQGGELFAPAGIVGGAGLSEVRIGPSAVLKTPSIQQVGRLVISGSDPAAYWTFHAGLDAQVGDMLLDGASLTQSGGQVRITGGLGGRQAPGDYHLPVYRLAGGTLELGLINSSPLELQLDGGSFLPHGDMTLDTLRVAVAAGSNMQLVLNQGTTVNARVMAVGNRGLLSLQGGTTVQGLILQAGGQSELRVGDALTQTYSVSVVDQALLSQSAGRIATTGVLSVDGGQFVQGGGQVSVGTQLMLDHGAHVQARGGTMYVNGNLTLGEGEMVVNGGSLTVVGSVVNGGGRGTLDWQSGSLALNGNAVALDTLRIGAGRNFVRGAYQHLSLYEGLVNRGSASFASLAELGAVDNQGLIKLDGGTGAATTLQQGGSLTLERMGSLRVGGDATFAAGSTTRIDLVSSITVAGAMVVDAAAQLSGPGDLIAQGSFATGAGLAKFEFEGRLLLGASSRLRLELGASGAADQLALGKELHLDGTLELVGLDGFRPAVGQQYRLFTPTLANGGAITGRFLALDSHAAPLPAGLAWDTRQLASDGLLSVTTVPEMPAAWMLAVGLPVMLTRRRCARR